MIIIVKCAGCQHDLHKPLLNVLETASAIHNSPLLFNLLEITCLGIQPDVHIQKLDPFISLSGCNQRWSGAALFSFPSHITLLLFSHWGFSLPLAKRIQVRLSAW